MVKGLREADSGIDGWDLSKPTRSQNIGDSCRCRDVGCKNRWHGIKLIGYQRKEKYK
jgi:hypothetical protein